MALSNSQYESIMRVYNRTQLQKKHELDARVDEVYEKIPAVREMNDAIAAAAVKSAKELLAGDADAVKRLRGTIADLKEQRQVLMSAYGYPADYLEMQYNCPNCKDTGYKDGKNATVSVSGRSICYTPSRISGKCWSGRIFLIFLMIILMTRRSIRVAARLPARIWSK